MIGCFLKSRILMVLGYAVTLAVALVIVVRRVGQPLWQTLITLILLLFLGAVLSRLLANFVAVDAHQKLLEVLYVGLDPEQFLSRYIPIVGRVKPATVTCAMVTCYLADGMCAAGRYNQALSALNSCIPPHGKSRLALECLLCDSKCHCLLQKGEADAATIELLQYDKLLQQVKQQNGSLAENLARKYRMFEQELAFLLGNKVDLDAVQEEIDHSPIHIRRLELTLLKAGVFIRDGRLSQADVCYQRVIEEGNGLALVKQAQRHRA